MRMYNYSAISTADFEHNNIPADEYGHQTSTLAIDKLERVHTISEVQSRLVYVYINHKVLKLT